jgi:arylformamidase
MFLRVRRKMKTFPLAAASALLWLANTAAAGEMRVERDVAYAEPKTERQTFDVYWDPAAKDRPIVVWIHGGGFSQGNKSEVHDKPQAFVERGFVFVSMNYRLMPAATVEEMAADVARCVRRLHDQARNYGGDPRSIVLMGHSAGAQLAALVATDDRYLRAEELTLANLRACVPVDGRFTLVRGGAESLTAPARHVAAGKNIPPFLILYHDLGRPESAAQSVAFEAILKASGVPARVYAAKGKDHTTINTHLGQADDPATNEVWKFFDTVFN